MVDLLNLARMTVASAPGTGGSVAMSAAVPGYLTFDLAGAVDGRTYRYGIRDGVNREISSGVYTASTKTLTRSVLWSTNSNAAINATINAVVAGVVAMEDIKTYYSGDNIPLNGDHSVSQQNFNTAVTGITNTLAYITDQWALANGGACVVSGARVNTSPPNGFRNYLQTTITTIDSSIAAADSLAILQFIEGFRTCKLGYGAAGALNSVWGFWARCSMTGTFSFALRNINNDRTYFKTFTIVAANTWEFKSFSIPGDITGTWNRDNSVGLCCIWSLMAGSNFQGTDAIWQAGNKWTTSAQTNFAGTISATFDVTGLCGFAGTRLITSDESLLLQRPFEPELLSCMRYWEASYDYGTAPGSIVTPGIHSSIYNATYTGGANGPKFKVQKRVPPTMTGYTASAGTLGSWLSAAGASAVTFQSVGVNGVRYTTLASENTWQEGHWVANSRL